MADRLNIAPMMDWTDRHCRYLLRMMSPNSRLFSEMVTAAAVRHGDPRQLLDFHEAEHPVALQLGGSDPALMAEASSVAEAFGYDEININVGCPSDRVQSGQFGACLMAHPRIIADCVLAMRKASRLPVTIKCRIGINEQDSYDFLRNFIGPAAEAGCRTFIVHARKAILEGLSPKENRNVPPLNYDRVYRLKNDHPELDIVLNGGIRTVGEALAHLQHVDGIMIGREAYRNPWFLVELDEAIFDGDGTRPADRGQVVQKMLPYIEENLASGTALKHITRHMLGLFSGQPGARAWRRHLSEQSHRRSGDLQVVKEALALQQKAA